MSDCVTNLVNRSRLGHDKKRKDAFAALVCGAAAARLVSFIFCFCQLAALASRLHCRSSISNCFLDGRIGNSFRRFNWLEYLPDREPKEIQWRIHMNGWISPGLRFASVYHMSCHANPNSRYNVFLPLFDFLFGSSGPLRSKVPAQATRTPAWPGNRHKRMPREAKILMPRPGSDCSIVVMKRSNFRGAKGAGHRRGSIVST